MKSGVVCIKTNHAILRLFISRNVLRFDATKEKRCYTTYIRIKSSERGGRKMRKVIIGLIIAGMVFCMGCESGINSANTVQDETNQTEDVETTTEDNCIEVEFGNGSEEIEIGDDDYDEQYVAKKPIIYFYPERTMDVNVKLDFNGTLTTTYPKYKNGGWNVVAEPGGTLTDKETGREYSYLFWEGNSDTVYDMSEGFVVAGKDTAEFLQKKLEYMGLTPKEYNEFIVYWLPEMENNKYNLINFQGKEYTENAKLEITPKPDSVLRVFMTWKALDEKVVVKEQKLSTFERKGFTVVEWGGAELH